jgi:2-dehydropantoate 2-reductase
MGQLFGARLELAGNEVALIDTSEATIDALNRGGVTLVVDGSPVHTAVRAGRARDFSGEHDLVIVFTKGFHTADAVRSVDHLIGVATAGLTLQNGLGNGEVLAARFGPDATWIGTTDFPADLPEPGRVLTSDGGKVRFGARHGRADERTAELAALLNAAGLHATAVAEIEPIIWEKVAFNAALNTLSAVAGRTVGQIAEDADFRHLVGCVIDETIAVARSQEIDVSRARIESAVDNAFKHHRHHKSSMLQDREAGRRTESDFIGGAVVSRGRAGGVPTPVLSTLTTLVKDPAGADGARRSPEPEPSTGAPRDGDS